MKSEIKREIIKFWQEHKDFDERNSGDVYDAIELCSELIRKYPEMEIIRAVEELRDEAEKAVEKAREKFYKAIERVNKGEEEG